MESTRIASLPQIHQACWDELQRAAVQRNHAWRLMALASVAERGGSPAADLRSVVLREVDTAAHAVVFFTDARSPKVAQLALHPQATLLAWSAALGWQLRLRVDIEVATSGLRVSSRWAQLKMTPAAQDYLSPLPPGAPVDRPTPERASRDHFAVATATVRAIDWLELHADGQRRASFDAHGQGQWLAP